MKVREIVKKYLTENGFDGLFQAECGCSLVDLMPCGDQFMADCNPGYKHPGDADFDFFIKEYPHNRILEDAWKE